RLLLQSGYELAVIDWQLPGLQGIEICKRYRQSGGRIPILMLTEKSLPREKGIGLDSGADDYLAKPFDTIELGARLRALLRRGAGTFTSKKDMSGVSLDRDSCCLVVKGRSMKVMPKEFELLEFLLRHPDNFFSGEQLLDHVWGTDSDVSVEALRTCVNRLRQR